MRKGYWIALGLILVLALSMFAVACGGEEETTTTAAPASTETTAPPASTETTAPPAESTTTAAANTAPLKFGIAISLTGDSAAPCEQIKQGFDTEAKYINANGGINGRQVELVYVDDQSKMDTAVAAIQTSWSTRRWTWSSARSRSGRRLPPGTSLRRPASFTSPSVRRPWKN